MALNRVGLLQRFQIGHNCFGVSHRHPKGRHWRVGHPSIARHSRSEQTYALLVCVADQTGDRRSLHRPVDLRIRRSFDRHRRTIQVFITNQVAIFVAWSVALDAHGEVFNNILALAYEIAVIR